MTPTRPARKVRENPIPESAEVQKIALLVLVSIILGPAWRRRDRWFTAISPTHHESESRTSDILSGAYFSAYGGRPSPAAAIRAWRGGDPVKSMPKPGAERAVVDCATPPDLRTVPKTSTLRQDRYRAALAGIDNLLEVLAIP